MRDLTLNELAILKGKPEAFLRENENINPTNFIKAMQSAKLMLEAIGEDPEREGLKDTPFRVAKMNLAETMIGYKYDEQGLIDLARSACFEDAKKGNIVLVKDIQFFSNCEHHMVPFFGKVHVAYIPGDTVLGLSKIPRVVQAVSRKLQLQEQLGQEVADAIQGASNARAVAVIVESDMHLCVSSRGVNDYNSNTTTIATASDHDGWGVDHKEFLDTVFKMLGK